MIHLTPLSPFFQYRYALAALALFISIGVAFILLIRYTPIPHPETVSSRISQGLILISVRTGLSLKNIHISGHKFLSASRILQIAKIQKNQPSLLANPHDIASQLSLYNGWFRSVSVSRTFPDTLAIQIKEHTPSAFWQYPASKHGTFVSNLGHTIPLSPLDTFSPNTRKYLENLPTLSGNNPSIPQKWAQLSSLLSQFPSLSQKLVKAHRLKGRRWNLILNSGLIIKLPEKKLQLALQKLKNIQKKHHLFSRNLYSLDLRFPPLIIVRKNLSNTSPQTLFSLAE
jgi:cell division protein FtsQ